MHRSLMTLALLTLTACGQGGPDRVFRFGADPAQDAPPAAAAAAAAATCADLAPAAPTRPQPAERPRPEVPHFDAPDGGGDGG